MIDIELQRARSAMAESVTLPIATWLEALDELEASRQVEPVKQVPPSLDDDEAEKIMATPKQEKCECVVKRLIFSGDREYCETCGFPIYTFEEHRARLLEERK